MEATCLDEFIGDMRRAVHRTHGGWTTAVLAAVAALVISSCSSALTPKYVNMRQGVGGPDAERIAALAAPFEERLGHPMRSMMNLAAPAAFGGGVIGLCYTWEEPDTVPLIQLNSDWWWSPYVSDDDRFALVVHEMGHCELGLDHVEDLGPDGCPILAMTASIGPVVDCLHRGFTHREDLLDGFDIYFQEHRRIHDESRNAPVHAGGGFDLGGSRRYE